MAAESRVLIADSDISVRRSIKTALESRYHVIEAKHGFEAVRLADTLTPDLIIIDSEIPGMTEIDICKRLKDLKHTKNIPLILISSHTKKEKIIFGLQAGADDYLTKPINPIDVLVRVDAHLRYKNFYNELERGDLQLLLELSDSISVLRNPMTILRMVVERVAGIIGVDRCSIVGINDNNDFTVKASNDLEMQEEIKLDLSRYPEIYKAHETRSAVVVNDTTSDPLMEPVRSQMKARGLNSIFVVPIIKKDSVIGSLFLGTATKLQEGISDRTYKLCHLVANICANALENAILFESIKTAEDIFEELVIRDGLTRLYTHRHFFDLLEKEFSRTFRYKTPLSLISFDIDNFKRINDKYGHMRGDTVIKQIGRVIIDVIRDNDVAARYGGEEFVVLLPNSSNDGALQLAQRIRILISELEHAGIDERVTVSAGVSTYAGDSPQPFDQLVQWADHALLKAKKQGKNKVVSYGS